jgi:radical SAM superfamily enzyme YgiQ (UPF0313 family)
MPTVENLGIAYLAACLRKNGIEADILDASISEVTHKQLLNSLPKKEYDIVGISASPQVLITEAIKIAYEIKTAFPECHIVVGGHFPTMAHHKILTETPCIDSVVRGEGETTLLDLVRALGNKKSLETVAGLSYRNPAGQIMVNGPRMLHDDLDALPWPVRDTLLQMKNLGHTWISQVSYSRGCFGNCSFCDIIKFYGSKRRTRSAKNLVDEIAYLRQLGCKDFRFADDESIGPSSASKVNIKSMALEILKRGLDVRYGIDSRATSVDPELFKLLKESGLELCFIGIESGVDRLLKLYNKGITVEQNIMAINLLKEAGVKLELGFVMFDPRMDFQELRQNYQFLKNNDLITLMGLRNWVQPLYGTRIVSQLKEQRLISRESLAEIEYFFVDEKVAKVFRFICRCAFLLQNVEHELYLSEKLVRFSETRQLALEKRHLGVWQEIFETAIENPGSNDFGWVEKQANALLQAIKQE